MVRTGGNTIRIGGGVSSKGAGVSNKRFSSGSASNTSLSFGTSSKSRSVGNRAIQRPTPKWQKPITSFFGGNKLPDETDVQADDEIEVLNASVDKMTDDEDADIMLQPPEWQKSVVEFVKLTNTNKEQPAEDDKENNVKVDDKQNEKRKVATEHDEDDAEINPPKRPRRATNFANLENWENL